MATLYYTKVIPTSDEFNGSSLDGKWTEDYQAGGDSTVSGGYLIITSGDERIIQTGAYDASGVYQEIEADVDFDIKVKLSSDTFTESGSDSQIGIGFYVQSDTYVALHNVDGYVYRLLNSTGSSGYFRQTPPSSPYYYRIKRVSTTVTLYTSYDGTEWTQRLNRTDPVIYDAGQFWIFANDAGDIGFTADFDWLRSIPNYDIVDCELQTSVSGGWDASLGVRYDGTIYYAQLESNLTASGISDLRVRKDGITYGVMKETT